MSSMLWRVLIAVVVVLVTFALIPPFMRVVGLDVSGDVMTIVRIVVAALAVLYVLRGPSPPRVT